VPGRPCGGGWPDCGGGGAPKWPAPDAAASRSIAAIGDESGLLADWRSPARSAGVKYDPSCSGAPTGHTRRQHGHQQNENSDATTVCQSFNQSINKHVRLKPNRFIFAISLSNRPLESRLITFGIRMPQYIFDRLHKLFYIFLNISLNSTALQYDRRADASSRDAGFHRISQLVTS